LSRVVEANRIMLAEHQLSLEEPQSDPAWVYGDATRLVQIFDNLLTNAIKYTPAGGHIAIELYKEGDHATVRVRDDGTGIDPETQAHIFEPFVQADVTLARSQGGLGVGLTLVQNLVSLHDGEIEVRSEGLGRGSEFEVRLPLVPAPDHPPTSTDNSGEEMETRIPRLMVVEDRPEIRETLAELLIDFGFEVSTAPDGLRGYQKMVEDPPDAALLDIGLPGLDGYELARRLRAHTSTAGLPLVAITGYGRAEDATKAYDAGFNTHLVKPVNIDDVISELSRLGIRPPAGVS
jgi:CheY-like chemotaxis protein